MELCLFRHSCGSFKAMVSHECRWPFFLAGVCPSHVVRSVGEIFMYRWRPMAIAVMSIGGRAHIVSKPDVGEFGKEGAIPRQASLLTLLSCFFRSLGSFFPAQTRHPYVNFGKMI